MQELNIPGFQNQKIAVKLSNGLKGPELFVNGQPAPPGSKRGQYNLSHDDGTQAIAYFKNRFPDPVPTLMVGERAIALAEPLAWYQWVWAGFPLILIFLGGAIGGGIGCGAATINTNIMRSERQEALKYALCALTSLMAFGLWLGIVLLIRG